VQPSTSASPDPSAASEASASSPQDLAIQIAAYAGVAMGLVGTVALVAFTTDPSETTILLVAIAVTAVLFGAGAAIRREPRSSTQRLRSVLWFTSLLGWAVVVEGFLVVTEIDLVGRSRQLLTAVLLAAAAVALWVGLRRTLQLIGAFVGLFSLLSAATFPEPDPFGQLDLVAPAVTSWVFGAVWMALGARGVVRPPRTALVLGTITVLLSPLVLGVSGSPTETTVTVVELWVVATSAACLIVGTWLVDRAVEGLAIVGILLSVSVLVGDLLGDSQGGAIAAVVVGVALLAGSILVLRSSRPATPPPPATPSALPEAPSH
jgi:hypothetical protein